jgi:hypothetical protein
MTDRSAFEFGNIDDRREIFLTKPGIAFSVAFSKLNFLSIRLVDTAVMERVSSLGAIYLQRMIGVIFIGPNPVFEDKGDIIRIMVVVMDVGEEEIMRSRGFDPCAYHIEGCTWPAVD